MIDLITYQGSGIREQYLRDRDHQFRTVKITEISAYLLTKNLPP